MVALAASVLFGMSTASAHANLTRSEPPADSSLAAAPTQVQLWFSEQPEPKLSVIRVVNVQGQSVEIGPARSASDDALALIAQIRPGLPEGAYTVSWQTTSAVDGHVTNGSFGFGVGVAASTTNLVGEARTRQSELSWSSAAVRWLNYLAFLLLLGVLVFESLVLERELSAMRASIRWTENLLRRFRHLAEALAGLGVLATLSAVIEQVYRSAGGFSADTLEATADTQLGRILLARAALAMVIVALLVVPLEAFVPPRTVGAASAAAMRVHRITELNQHVVVPPLVLGELLLMAMTSHALASTGAPVLILVADWAHLSVAGIWIGGLVALALVVMPGMRPSQRAGDGAACNETVVPLLKRFSQVALLATVGLAASGLCLAWAHVGSPANLFATDYGHALVFKNVLFAAALSLAALNRFVLLPASTRSKRQRSVSGWWRGSVPAEAFLGLAMLATAAVGTNLPPPAESSSPGPIAATDVAGVRLALHIEPLKPGPNTFEMTLQRRGTPILDAEKVELQMSPATGGQIGPAVVDLVEVGQGAYAAKSDALSLSGPWQVKVLVRTLGELDREATFDVAVPANDAPFKAPPTVTTALPQAGDLTFGSNIAGALVGLTVRPGLPGRNQLLVYVAETQPPAGSRLVVNLDLQGTMVPLQQCAATCWVGTAKLRGDEDAQVTIGGLGAPAQFHIPALPASAADELLTEVTQRMHQLRTLRLDETYVTAKLPLTIHYEVQAPDRLSAQGPSGEMVSVGRSRLIRSAPDQPWQRSELRQAPTVPSFMWDGLSVQSAYLASAEPASDSNTQVVVFSAMNGESPVWFQLWVNGDGLAQQMQMRASHHFMDQRFFDYNEPIAIKLPGS